MDTVVIILLIILIIVVVVFGINSMKSSTNEIPGVARSSQSLPAQYGGGGCGR